MLDHSYICIPRVRSLGTEFLDSWIFKFFFEFSLLEKCPNTELFLVRIFLYSDWIRRFTGKYGPEIIPYLDTFYAVFVKLKKKALWPLFLWMGFNCLKPLWVGSLLFTIQFPEIPGTHVINLGRIKGWVDLEVTQWFWTQDPWIGNPAP